MQLQYALEFHTALIAVSSTFMVIAGIIVAMFVSREDARDRLNRLCIQLELASIAPGVISVIVALSWFLAPSEDGTLTATIALGVQFGLMYLPLGFLMARLDR